ncbi:MAG: response regulator [Spirochaetia bacterium]|jgi:two-component system chemotaxis response regulator CheY|nr:response regulator [Spirochaetia bacterium]
MEDGMQEVFEMFFEELAEQVRVANDCVLQFEEGRDAQQIEALFRSLHTIKGNSMMLGFETLGAIAHSAESVIVKLRNETLEPTKSLMDLLLAVLDAIEAQARSARYGQPEPAGAAELMALLDSVAKAPAAGSTQAAVPSAQTVVPPAQTVAVDIRAAGEDREATNPQPPQPPQLARSAKQFSMLVVDDDFVSRKILAKLLEPYGSCDMASDGLEAVAAFSNALAEVPYDFVFLDIMLPGMDGYEVAKQIRSTEMTAAMAAMKDKATAGNQFSRDDTIIVMVSSLDDPESCFKACYRSGANTYIVKPADKAGIDQLMAKYLR